MARSALGKGRRRCLMAAGAWWCAGALPLARAAETAGATGPIVVGQSIALQGGRNTYAAEVEAGIAAQLAGVNAQGGVGGRRIVLRTLDDGNDPARAEAHARKLVAEGAFVLFGSLEGGPSTAVAQVATELKVPFIGPIAGSPGLRRPHQPMVFPVRAEHRDEFRALIEQGLRIGLRRVALFHADSGVGRAHLANVEALAKELGAEFAGGLAFRPDAGEAEIAALVRAIESTRAELVINHGSVGLYERLIRQTRAAGLRTTFWGANSGSTQLAAALGPLAHGMVFSQIVPNPHSRKTALVREYQQEFAAASPGHEFSYGSLEGYATAKVLVAALRQAGSPPTRAALLRALEHFEFDLGGITLRYRPGDHAGSRYVDLAMVGRDGRFVQ